MLPGCGDQATWGKCYGHPHDPRTPEYDEEIDMSFDGTAYTLRDTASKLERLDRLLDYIAEFLDELREDAVLDIRYGQTITTIMARMRDI